MSHSFGRYERRGIVERLQSTSFEDAIRNAISIGGDSDTVAAITGSVAEAYYGIPAHLRETALTYLPQELKQILAEFEDYYPAPVPMRRQLETR